MLLKIFSYNIHGLPYLPDQWTSPLGLWFKNTDYDFICLQEVFTVGRTSFLSNSLQKEGYTVCKPNDFLERQNLLGSGLITAVKSDTWSVESEGFIQFKESVGAENLANKGVHWLILEHRVSGKPLLLINTHMQADHPFNYFTGCLDAQLYEFIKTLSGIKHIIVGDLNSETEAHEELQYLTGSSSGIKKHTFEPTGEDLDHVAFFYKFWPKRPVLKVLSILSNLWWSDHWPLHAIIEI